MFNYKYLGKCQFGVYDKYNADNGFVSNCDEPAMAIVWWDNNGSNQIYVCQKHLEEIEKSEAIHNTIDLLEEELYFVKESCPKDCKCLDVHAHIAGLEQAILDLSEELKNEKGYVNERP